ncbi:MAG: right-handed parallel beta-helix repeat-containing protein [Kiritimatiellae bacterium]|nr:right-handed parallel beta-helix repeat-containing protein [Kiritimatiellia bacterium]
MCKKIEAFLFLICCVYSLNLVADLPVGDVAWLTDEVSKSVEGDVISIPKGEYKLSSTLAVAAGVTIKSATGKREDVVLDGQGTIRCVSAKANSVIKSITIKHGYANINNNAAGGGGIHSDGAIITNCVIESCNLLITKASNYSGGGGIYAKNKSIIINCFFTNNVCDINQLNPHGGGALCVGDKDTVVEKCTFINNTAKNAPNYFAGGGGVFFGSAGGTIRGCYFGPNSAGYGRCIYGLPAIIDDCTFADNIYHSVVFMYLRNCASAHILFRNSKFLRNVNSNLENTKGPIIIRNDSYDYQCDFEGCVFEGNIINRDFIHDDNTSQTKSFVNYLSNCVFRCNYLTNGVAATALLSYRNQKVKFYGLVVEGNTLDRYGALGLFNVGTGSIFENCKFIGNSFNSISKNNCSCIRIQSGARDVCIRNCLFEKNIARQSYGVAVSYAADSPSNIIVDNCTFSHNSQNGYHFGAYGGMICVSSNSVVRNSLFYGNTCAESRTVFYPSTSDVSVEKNFFNCCDANSVKQLKDVNNCLLLDATPEAVGFVKADPTIDHDYSLSKKSPLVDKGMDLDWIIEKETLDVSCEKRHFRLEGKAVDIGAYEYRPFPGFYLIVK